ncbi:MAG: transketolase [Cyclobacteriaceae bacterium]|nr:transketolase [Cyclobacteriaceae bacterium]
MQKNKIENLNTKSENIRKRILQIIFAAKAGHTGGSLSSVDILTALYFEVMKTDPSNPDWKERDRFIMSKGHSVEALYCVLSAAGYFEDAILETYGNFNSPLAGHPTRKIPGIELNSGALGHGLSVGTGMALAAKRDASLVRVFVLMGDGEQGEGSIYEAAMAAAHYKLSNLTAIIDRNQLQISGNTEDVMAINSIYQRWESLGWHVTECDGHNLYALCNQLSNMSQIPDKPHLLIAHTIKGKGVSFMENNVKWHHGVPNDQQFKDALKEIDQRLSLTI